MEIPIFAFSAFFRVGHFENDPGEGVHPKIFPVNIADSYSIGSKLSEKYRFIEWWGGCTRTPLSPRPITVSHLGRGPEGSTMHPPSLHTHTSLQNYVFLIPQSVHNRK